MCDEQQVKNLNFSQFPVLLYCSDKNLEQSVHLEIAEAISAYHGNACNVIRTSMIDVVRSLPSFKILYIQKSSFKNLVILLFSRILGVYTILYVHEPLTVRQRITKGVPFVKAVAVTFFHLFEVMLPNTLLTGNPNNKNYRLRALRYAPLLYIKPKIQIDWSTRVNDILYFGRLDSEKYFKDFEQLSVARKVIATSNLNIPASKYSISRLSRQDKDDILSAHKYVWCVQKHNLTQSGVVLDALRSGCVLLLREFDPLINIIHTSEYISIPIPFDSDVVLDKISDYERRYPTGPIEDSSFDSLAGPAAFKKYWGKVLNFDGA